MTLILFERNVIRPINVPASETCHSERKEKASEASTNFSVLKMTKLDNHDTSLRQHIRSSLPSREESRMLLDLNVSGRRE